MTAVDTSAAAPTAPETAYPVRVGSPETFAAVRAMFTRHGFTAAGLCARYGLPSIFDFKRAREGRPAPEGAWDGLETLVRLLMDSEPVPAAEARARLGDAGVDALEALGVIGPDPADPARLAATVILYPLDELWIASDLWSLDKATADIVFPAITEPGRRFYTAVPRSETGTVLELCAGTGVGALLAAGHAREVWATDITARSVWFSRFNAALNGFDHFVAAEGDLYGAVGDRRFDRIIAHPPYVPALVERFIFREAGEDGERLSRTIIAEAPRHLNPGGEVHVVALFPEGDGQPLEERVRAMLGADADRFDVVVNLRQIYPAVAYAMTQAEGGAVSYDALGGWLQRLKERSLTRFVIAAVMLRHVTEDRPVNTLRRVGGPACGGPEHDWMLRWAAVSARPDFHARVLDAHVRGNLGVSVRLRHELTPDGWSFAGCELATTWPALAAAPCPPGLAEHLGVTKGEQTVRELYARFSRDELLPDGVTEGEFVTFVERLAGAGLIELDLCPLPPRRAASAHDATTTATSTEPAQSTRQ